MADLIVVYWRDIPAQIIVKRGRASAKRELPRRFIEAIDRCAMRGGLAGTQDYLGQWRRGVAQPCGDDLELEAEAALARINAAYDDARLKALVDAGGREA